MSLFSPRLVLSHRSLATKMQSKLYDANRTKNERQLDFHLSNALVVAELQEGNSVEERQLVEIGVMELCLRQEMWRSNELFIPALTNICTCTYLAICARKDFYPSLSLRFRKNDVRKMQARCQIKTSARLSRRARSTLR